MTLHPSCTHNCNLHWTIRSISCEYCVMTMQWTHTHRVYYHMPWATYENCCQCVWMYFYSNAWPLGHRNKWFQKVKRETSHRGSLLWWDANGWCWRELEREKVVFLFCDSSVKTGSLDTEPRAGAFYVDRFVCDNSRCCTSLLTGCQVQQRICWIFNEWIQPIVLEASKFTSESW